MGIRDGIVGNRIVVGGHGAIGHDRYSILDIGHEIGGYGHVAGIEDENPRARATRGSPLKSSSATVLFWTFPVAPNPTCMPFWAVVVGPAPTTELPAIVTVVPTSLLVIPF